MLGSSGTACVRPVPGKGGTRRPGAFLRGAAASSESSSRNAASMDASIASRWLAGSIAARLMRVPELSCSELSAGLPLGRPLRRGAELWRLARAGVTKAGTTGARPVLSAFHSQFSQRLNLIAKGAARSASPLLTHANRSRSVRQRGVVRPRQHRSQPGASDLKLRGASRARTPSKGARKVESIEFVENRSVELRRAADQLERPVTRVSHARVSAR